MSKTENKVDTNESITETTNNKERKAFPLKVLLAILLLLSLMLNAYLFYELNSFNRSIKENEAEIGSLSKQLEALTSQNVELKEQIAELSKAVNTGSGGDTVDEPIGNPDVERAPAWEDRVDEDGDGWDDRLQGVPAKEWFESHGMTDGGTVSGTTDDALTDPANWEGGKYIGPDIEGFDVTPYR